jgi:AcrR family transcriptional regulator
VYRSEVRAEQADRTRERILDAVVRLIERGDRDLAYAGIAKEARIALATVYRHFPDRAELFASVCRKVESMRPAIPEVASFDRPTFEEQIRKHWARFDDPSSLEHRATRLSAMFELSRVGSVPRRRAVIEKLVNDAAPRLREPHRTYVIELLVVIASSATVEAFRGYLGRGGAETADRVMFAVDALLAHAASLQPPEVP